MQKESLLDVLLYLFEAYMDSEIHLTEEPTEFSKELRQAGFSRDEVTKALAWFDELQVSLGAFKRSKRLGAQTVRVFSKEENFKLTREARNYILYLESIGFIDAKSRELIINRAMTLEGDTVDVAEIKWMSLTVLLTQPDQKDRLAHLEALVLNDQGYIRH